MYRIRQFSLRIAGYISLVLRVWKQVLLALIAIVLVGAAAYFLMGSSTAPGTTRNSIQAPASANKSTAGNNNAAAANKTIAHIFIIVEENRVAGSVVGNPGAPYINSLINQYALATNYSGVTHPSLPNYLALTSGSNDGITTDCNPPGAGCIVNVASIADEIEASGRTWKEYAEGMPSPCYQLNSGNYATKHVPFLYYQDVIANSSRCKAHVVPFTQLAVDLKSASTTPDYAFISPNLCNDMHNCSLSTGDSWLASNVPLILNSPAFTSTRSLLVITWDEGDVSDNSVAAILAGSAAKRHYSSGLAYNHYSLLHTIEWAWGLKPLTANDANAPLMNGFIQP